MSENDSVVIVSYLMILKNLKKKKIHLSVKYYTTCEKVIITQQ